MTCLTLQSETTFFDLYTSLISTISGREVVELEKIKRIKNKQEFTNRK